MSTARGEGGQEVGTVGGGSPHLPAGQTRPGPVLQEVTPHDDHRLSTLWEGVSVHEGGTRSEYSSGEGSTNEYKISKLDLFECGSFSPTIFNIDIELSVYHISCFISVCPFVALSKATFAEDSHIVLTSPY